MDTLSVALEFAAAAAGNKAEKELIQ